MDHAAIDAEQVAERYALGRLDDASETSFEEHLVACARCQGSVEAAAILAAGLPRSAPSAAMPATGRWAWLAAAACLAGAAALSLFFLGRERGLRHELAVRRDAEEAATRALAEARSARPAGSAAVLRLSLPRSGGEDGAPVNEASPPRAPGWLVLLVDRPGDVPAGAIRAAFVAADGRTLFESGLSPAPDDALALAVSPAMAAPGDYRVRLVDARPGRGGVLAEYSVRLSPAP
jgi:hypothetical protein